MKRTTYILIGLLVAGFCVLIGGMLTMYFTAEPYNPKSFNMQGERVTKELPSFRVIWLAQEKMKTDDNRNGSRIWLANSLLKVIPSNGEKSTLCCSEKVNDCLKMTVVGDTLKILLDYPIDKLKEEFKDSKYVELNIGDMQLSMTQDVECIIDDISGQNISLENIAKDSLSINISNSLVMSSCNFEALNIIRSGPKIDFQSGTIKNLHLNLSMMSDWYVNVDDCHIDTEYLTGDSSRVFLQKGECKRMFWIPIEDGSELAVTLSEKACVTIMD